MKFIFKMIKCIFVFLCSLAIVSTIMVFGIDLYMRSIVGKNIIEVDNIADISDNEYDIALILGCAVYGNIPSPMLKERLDAGIELYKENKVSKLLMSGDNSEKYYNEVAVMKDYATEHGVDPNDIYLDHAGFSTYDSIYRSKEIFNLSKFLVVSQKYHLYRAIYISKSLGLDVQGVSSDKVRFSGQIARDIREILARNKDFVKCIFKPSSKFLGDQIQIE